MLNLFTRLLKLCVEIEVEIEVLKLCVKVTNFRNEQMIFCVLTILAVFRASGYLKQGRTWIVETSEELT